jgi:undecaprenyl-diphosphatase
VRGKRGPEKASSRPVLTRQASLGWWLLLATLPAGVMGLLWADQFEALFQSPLYVAGFLLLTGIWLVVAERMGHGERLATDVSWWQALLIGLAQGCAITPGISRSGATIGAGLLAGLKREEATRFSFLQSVPIILAAGLFGARKLLEAGALDAGVVPLAAGFVAAFVTGLLCIRWLLGFVRRRGLTVFAAYCWTVGLLSIALYLLR